MAMSFKLGIRKSLLLVLACITLFAVLSPAAQAAEIGTVPENSFLKLDSMNDEQIDAIQAALDDSDVKADKIPVFHVWIKNPEGGYIEVQCATLVTDPVHGGVFLITPSCEKLIKKNYSLKRIFNESFDKSTVTYLGDDGLFSYLSVEGLDEFTPLEYGTAASNDLFGITLLAKSRLELEGMGAARFDTRSWSSEDGFSFFSNGVNAQKGFIPGGPVISLFNNEVVGFTAGEEDGSLAVCLHPEWTLAQKFSIAETKKPEEPAPGTEPTPAPAEDEPQSETDTEEPAKEPLFTKKEKIIIAGIAVAVILLAAILSAKAGKNRADAAPVESPVQNPAPKPQNAAPSFVEYAPEGKTELHSAPPRADARAQQEIAVRDVNGKIYRGPDRMTFGRDPRSTVFFDGSHESVSIAHCVLYHEDGKLFLKDTGSTNGTYFSANERIEKNKPYPVSKGESFYITDARYKFTIVEG